MVQGLCHPFSLFFFQQTHTVATLIRMKITNYSSNTHYVVHILTAQAALDSWCTAHWKFSSISVALTASQNCSCPQTDKVLVLQHKLVSESALTCTFILYTLKLKHFLFTSRFSHPLTLVNSSKHRLTRRQKNSLNRGILLGNSSIPPDMYLPQVPSSPSLRPVVLDQDFFKSLI